MQGPVEEAAEVRRVQKDAEKENEVVRAKITNQRRNSVVLVKGICMGDVWKQLPLQSPPQLLRFPKLNGKYYPAQEIDGPQCPRYIQANVGDEERVEERHVEERLKEEKGVEVRRVEKDIE